MCERYVTGSDEMSWREWHEVLTGTTMPEVPPAQPRWLPMSQVPVFAVANDAPARLEHMQWGLVPSFAKSTKDGRKMFNLRAETVGTRFKKMFERRRCILPATGFWHWEKKADGTKQPWLTTARDRSMFGLLGVWTGWGDASFHSCTVLTTEPNEEIARFHDRMPALVFLDRARIWLDASTNVETLHSLMHPCPPEKLTSRKD